ncbi:MAG: sugar phosphate nucleotidyltransferase [Thermoplasmatales archaeon]
MKGIILHGGSGTRLRPLTYTDVRQLLPLAGKPVSEYILNNMIEIGINEINIITGEVGDKDIRDYYGDGLKLNVMRKSYFMISVPVHISQKGQLNVDKVVFWEYL